MVIIGEKINGAIPGTAKAIAEKNEQYIKDLAARQTEAGADYLDVCSGTSPELEYDTLAWLLDIVQSSVEIPICIDSPNPEMLLKVLPKIQKPGLINSVSEEGNKCELIYPFLKDNPGWKIVALTCDNAGIPSDADTKAKIGLSLIEKAAKYGINPERIYIDPLVLSVSAVSDAMLQFMKAIELIKTHYPTVHYTSGLSNISYGMPVRSLINRNFLTLALSAGMDSAILDPLNASIMETLLAVEVLLDKDKHCRNYNKAYRAGKIGAKK
jgi:5-methyltetrahydrofolate--homocysteine methyltransferase